LSPRKSRLDLVPPFDLFGFAKLPAEQHDAAVAAAWEFYETTGIILQ